MEGATIIINGTEYPIKFGLGAFRKMGEKWGCKGYDETVEKLNILQDTTSGFTFEQEDVIIDLIQTGIAFADASIELPERDIVFKEVLGNVSLMETITEELGKSFPTVEGKSQPPQKVAKPKQEPQPA